MFPIMAAQLYWNPQILPNGAAMLVTNEIIAKIKHIVIIAMRLPLFFSCVMVQKKMLVYKIRLVVFQILFFHSKLVNSDLLVFITRQQSSRWEMWLVRSIRETLCFKADSASCRECSPMCAFKSIQPVACIELHAGFVVYTSMIRPLFGSLQVAARSSEPLSILFNT